MDSDTSRHMCNDTSLLEKMVMVNDVVEVGEGTLASVKEIGTLRAEVVADGVSKYIVSNEVQLVPNLSTNQIFVRCLKWKDINKSFSNDQYDAKRGVVFIIEIVNGKTVVKGLKRVWAF